jgi:hypothetical protein
MVSDGGPGKIHDLRAFLADRVSQGGEEDVVAYWREIARQRGLELERLSAEYRREIHTAAAEVERLTQENTRLRAGLALNLEDVQVFFWNAPSGTKHALHPSEVEVVVPPHVGDRWRAERDVIEKAKAYEAAHFAWKDTAARDEAYVRVTLAKNQAHQALLDSARAVDALGDSQGDTDGQ